MKNNERSNTFFYPLHCHIQTQNQGHQHCKSSTSEHLLESVQSITLHIIQRKTKQKSNFSNY